MIWRLFENSYQLDLEYDTVMRNIKTILTAAVLVAAMPLSSHAEGSTRAFGDVYAECGLGAMIFSRNTDNDRILAMISNITWDLGTTAHSSNMSSAENCITREATAALFIMENLPQIEGDIAKGTGDHLAAAVGSFGCEAQLPSLTSELQAKTLESIDTGVYANMSEQEKSAQIFDTINSSCTI